MNEIKRAVIVLTCFDFESLQLTLLALNHTLQPTDKVVIILNGVDSLSSAKVERIARNWAAFNPKTRHVVRPLCSGAKAYFAIKEILTHYAPLKNVDFICKLDDDVIPLKSGWLDGLEEAYLKTSADSSVGFTTGLINNNNWGFNELLDIFDKRNLFEQMFDYRLRGGIVTGFQTDTITNDSFGTIWQEPFLAWWTHQWTTLEIDQFISITENLGLLEIPMKTVYSIGCVFFKKELWLNLDHKEESCFFDEELLHRACLKEDKIKLAVMNQPMIHLFYYNQRIPNRDLLATIATSLENYFSDDSFGRIQKIGLDELMINLGEQFAKLNAEMTNFFKAVAGDPE